MNMKCYTGHNSKQHDVQIDNRNVKMKSRDREVVSLGNLEFGHRPEMAIRHYDIGVRIGNLSLEPDFQGVLPWGLTDNRPYLRCLHGYALCLWRLNRYDEAAAACFDMLRLNPTDNQGARFNVEAIRAHSPWEDEVET